MCTYFVRPAQLKQVLVWISVKVVHNEYSIHLIYDFRDM